MSRLHRKRILRLAIFIVIVSLMIPSMFGVKGDAWRDYIYEFQTLIGGVLALGAAYITLGQMQESDQLQEGRHAKQIAVANRRDRLIIDRFSSANLFWLRNHIENMRPTFETSSQIMPAFRDIPADIPQPGAPLPPWPEFRIKLKAFHQQVGELMQEIGSGRPDTGDIRLVDARPLFSSAMLNTLIFLAQVAIPAYREHFQGGDVEAAVDAATAGDNAPDWFTSYLMMHINRVYVATVQFTNEAEKFGQLIEK